VNVAPEPELEVPELVFGAGLPGFPEARRFALVRLADDTETPFAILRCLDFEGLEFVVVHPFEFFPAYSPELDDETAERLDLRSQDDAVILAIVTVPDEVKDATANLAAPIIVNRRTRQAMQAVLGDIELDLRAPLKQLP
jgi:flagellar assembly factor FliW